MKRVFHCADCDHRITLNTHEVEMPCIYCGGTMLVVDEGRGPLVSEFGFTDELSDIAGMMRDNRGIRVDDGR